MADTRWTAETEELVARAIYGRRTGTNVDGFTDWDWDNAPMWADARRAWRKRAASVLTALADAGVLIPVGGETRQEIERAGFRRGWTERDRAMVIGRCWSCDHESAMHQPDGCWYAVTNGTVGQNSVCACSEPKPREVTDDPA